MDFKLENHLVWATNQKLKFVLIGTQAFVRSSTVCYMVYVPWYKIHVHGNVFPELSKMNQRINIMVSPLAKESTPPRKHFQQLRTFWEKKRSGTPTFVSAGENKDPGSMRDMILSQECGSEHKEEEEVSKTILTFVIPQELEVMSLYHTYIASRLKADSVIQGITIP